MRLLIVDDEENIRKGLVSFLGLHGHEADAVGDLASARAALSRAVPEAIRPYGAILLDVYLGTENGNELLDSAAGRPLAAPIVMMSGRGRVKDAVAAVRKGAYDFLEKPIDTDRLLATLRNIERESAAERTLEALREDWLSEHMYFEPGSAMATVVEEARRIAASPLSVLVTGPTGSGKELVARWIHICSPRSRGPFVAVNCAAIPPELAESAFFGSLKGSFTGAGADRRGYFASAAGGTLFLDEIGEIGLPLQAKLLRATETGEIQKVGAELSERTDARIVAATNRDLEEEIEARRFREDLFWRLAQTRLRVPALGERRAEIRGLAAFLAGPVGARIGASAPSLGEEALAWLESRDWQGNARELRAFVERALWLAPPGAEIGAAYMRELDGAEGGRRGAGNGIRSILVSPNASSDGPAERGAAKGTGGSSLLSAIGLDSPAPLSEAKGAFERAYVARALAEAGGSVARAAEALGLLPNNLSRKLKELGISRLP